MTDYYYEDDYAENPSDSAPAEETATYEMEAEDDSAQDAMSMAIYGYALVPALSIFSALFTKSSYSDE